MGKFKKFDDSIGTFKYEPFLRPSKKLNETCFYQIVSYRNENLGALLSHVYLVVWAISLAIAKILWNSILKKLSLTEMKFRNPIESYVPDSMSHFCSRKNIIKWNSILNELSLTDMPIWEPTKVMCTLWYKPFI